MKALIKSYEHAGVDAQLLRRADAVNEAQAPEVVRRTISLAGSGQGKTVRILGLAFRKDTDDVRDAASLRVIRILLDKGLRVKAYYPRALQQARAVLDHSITYANSVEECLTGTDCCILLTERDGFRSVTPTILERLMRHAALVDARRLLKPQDFEGRIAFAAIGRGPLTEDKHAQWEPLRREDGACERGRSMPMM